MTTVIVALDDFLPRLEDLATWGQTGQVAHTVFSLKLDLEDKQIKFLRHRIAGGKSVFNIAQPFCQTLLSLCWPPSQGFVKWYCVIIGRLCISCSLHKRLTTRTEYADLTKDTVYADFTRTPCWVSLGYWGSWLSTILDRSIDLYDTQQSEHTQTSRSIHINYAATHHAHLVCVSCS